MSRLTKLLLAICLLGFALRLFQLDAESIWWDEGISLHLATSSWLEIMANRVVNIHPPLYFFLLKVWVNLVGTSPFAARYLSVLASFLWIPAVYRFMQMRDSYSKWVAVSLVTCWPLAIVYGQEVRVYAFLPLIYLTLIGLTEKIIHERPKRPFITLGLAAWLALHLHYITFFVVAYVGVWGFLTLIWQKAWLMLRRWVMTFMVVALASLPWFIAVLLNLEAVQQEATAGTFLTEPVSLPFLLQQVWWFQLTGFASFEQAWVLTAVALAGFLFVLWLWTVRQTKGQAILPMLHWLVPLVFAFLAWSVRSFAHPRYVIAFAIGWIVLVAYLLAQPFLRRRALPIVLLFISVLYGYSLTRYFFNPDVGKSPMREIAQVLEEEATAVDYIIMPNTDWSLQFEYDGKATLLMADQTLEASLSEVSGTVYVVDYKRGTLDWAGVVPYLLAQKGVLVEERSFDDLILWQYQLNSQMPPFRFESIQQAFGPLQLIGVEFQNDRPSNGRLALSLWWRGLVNENYKIGLRLVDETGWVWAQKDDLLIDVMGRPTHVWPDNQSVETYHVLPLQNGTPPQTLDLIATIYVEGEPAVRAAQIGSITLSSPHPNSNNDFPAFENQLFAQPLPIADGVALTKGAIYPQTLALGQPLTIWLEWEATQVPLDGDYQIVLVQNGAVLQTAVPLYPPTQWEPPLTVVDRQLLRLLPPAQSGSVGVVLQWGEQSQLLTQVTIENSDLTFVPPTPDIPLDVTFGGVVRLVGVDVLDEENGSLTTTLYWQPLQSNVPADWVVFAQILDASGQVVGQEDGPMGNGRYPQSWIADEYITDSRMISVPDLANWQLIVGLYDPNTGERLLTGQGEDKATIQP